MKKIILAISLVITGFIGNTATAKGIELFLQNGASASAIASAVSLMSGCKKPLKFVVGKKPDPALGIDWTLFVLCEDDDGEGGILIGYSKDEENNLFPRFLEPRP